jgi:cysteine desulfurase
MGGATVTVDQRGVIDLDALSAALDGNVAVVSVMLANNEVGTIQPVAEVVELVRRKAPGAVVHSDAIAAAPWLDVADLAATADLVSVAGHKVGGPKGVGVLVVRRGTALAPVLHGGAQEHDRRPGTHDVAGIVGTAAALVATVAHRADDVVRIGRLRDRLADGLLAAIDGATETGRARGSDGGGPDRRGKVAGSCHLLIEGVDQEELLLLADQGDVYGSAGAACASGALEPSHVLLAMGLDEDRARTGIRLSLGPATTEAEVDLALEILPKAVEQLRG